MREIYSYWSVRAAVTLSCLTHQVVHKWLDGCSSTVGVRVRMV